MTPAPTSGSPSTPLRIGIPWRTTKEQQASERKKLNDYFESVKKAGAEPTDISLNQSPAELQAQLTELDGSVLPGSPTNASPTRYSAAKQQKTNGLDNNLYKTRIAILNHAF